MDEAFGRREMITPAQLRQFTAKSDLRGFVQLGSHIGAIMATGTLLALTWGSWLAVPVFLLHGVLINFLYAGQHELSHSTVFKVRGFNELFGRILGFVALYPRDYDQIQHFCHHRHTNIPGRDCDLARPPYSLPSYLLWLLGLPYWRSRVRFLLLTSAGKVTDDYIPEQRKPGLVLEARLHMAGYAAIASMSIVAGSWVAVSYWLAPMILTRFAHQLQNTIEHLGMPHVEEIPRNTRSTRTNAAMRWACWNMQYHTAHHAFPGVPFYHLPSLHRVIFLDKGRKPPEMSYLGFQAAALRAFSGGRRETDYPDDMMWISDNADPSDLQMDARP